MGFGTLFIGYFLILNISYYHFTDIIAALIMLLGLYKLSMVSRHFKVATCAALGFSAVALGELIFGTVKLFIGAGLDEWITYIAIGRAVVLCAFTVIVLRALYDISSELDVEKLPLKCRLMTIWTFVVYGVYILLETPLITNLLPMEVTAALYLVTLIGLIVVVISNLTLIYACYMRICMPEDLEPKPEKPSRFKFINEYRERRDERRREEMEAERRRLEEKKRRRGKK